MLISVSNEKKNKNSLYFLCLLKKEIKDKNNGLKIQLKATSYNNDLLDSHWIYMDGSWYLELTETGRRKTEKQSEWIKARWVDRSWPSAKIAKITMENKFALNFQVCAMSGPINIHSNTDRIIQVKTWNNRRVVMLSKCISITYVYVQCAMCILCIAMDPKWRKIKKNARRKTREFSTIELKSACKRIWISLNNRE